MKAATWFLVVSLLAAGFAQAATTSRLTGTVVDTDDAPLPGVTVQLWSEVLIGGRQTAVADSEGRVAFNLLPPGPYLLGAELPGFVPVELEARVALDTETQVRLTMVAQAFSDTIEVNGEAPLVDVSQVGGGESYNREYLKNASVGIEGRDWLATVLETPGATSIYGVSPRNVMAGKNPSVMGSLQSDNTYLIDWLNVTDPLTGTFYAWLNHDALQEASMVTTGLDAEYGYALGGVVNLVTRSGGNSLSGSLDVRYRDEGFNESGQHFDPDDDVSSLRAVTAAMGGPVARDRLWFFASLGQRLEKETPTGSPVTRENDRLDWLTKLTWQASGSMRVTFKTSDFPVDDHNFNAGDPVFETYTLNPADPIDSWGGGLAPEAHGRLESSTRVIQGELHSVLTDSLLLSLQAGMNRGHLDIVPVTGDLSRPAHMNVDAQLWFNNSPYLELSDRDSDQYRASLSWFLDEMAGRHELKAGVEHRRLDTRVVTGHAGGEVHWLREVFDPETNPDGSGCSSCDFNDDGWVDWSLRVPAGGDQQSSSRMWGVFLQDSWRPLAGLTVKAGVRLDTVEHRDRRGQTVADFDEWQPRLGLAWDPFGTGEQVVRASWGRVMHPGSTALPGYVNDREILHRSYRGYEYLCGNAPGTVLCDREWLAENWGLGEELVTTDEHGNEHYWYLQDWAWLNATRTLDTLGVGHLEAQWAEILSIAVERQLWQETSLELGYVDKKTRDLIEESCASNTWLWDESVTDPSIDDPDSWTDVDECLEAEFVYANMPQVRRDYQAWIARLETRYRSLNLKASYTHASSKGSSSTEAWNAYVGGAYDFFPLDFYNTYGYMDDDRRHVVKLAGWAGLPWDLTASFAYSWRSAPAIDTIAWCADLTREWLVEAGYDPAIVDYCEAGGFPTEASWSAANVYLEPRGSRRGRASYNLDLMLAKNFRVSTVSLELNLAVLNVWGAERPKQYNELEFHRDGLAVGEPTKWTEPRRYQLGVRVEF